MLDDLHIHFNNKNYCKENSLISAIKYTKLRLKFFFYKENSCNKLVINSGTFDGTASKNLQFI